MNKPNNYDDVRASGEFTPVAVGGHYCTIKQVSETQSKNGQPMIVVLFDFDNKDNQAGYFMQAYKEDLREEKKWPFQGSSYILVNDYKNPNTTSKKFKTFCACVEKSNSYEITWGGEDWGKQFVGKKVGAVYGLEENEFNGNTSMRPTFKWFCNVDAVAGAKIPEPKYLDKKAQSPFTVITEAYEQLPF